MGRITDRPYKVFRRQHRNLHRELWDRIEKRDPKLCWRWMGEHDAQGLPEYAFPHEDGPHRIQVHRYLYYAVYDELPCVVEHACGNDWCCNVNHLTGSSVPVLQA